MCTPGKGRKEDNRVRRLPLNLDEPVPLGTKIKHISTNLWIKVSKLQSCCGHPGQAGC
jgi:hypothetical protein